MPPTSPGPDGPGLPTRRPGSTSRPANGPSRRCARSREKAGRPEVLGGIGGFAGLFALKLGRYTEPVLAASTDGVGTKIAVAQAMDKHDTIGLDLVAMVVDDLVVCGAEPLFLQDYIAVGKLVPEHVAAAGVRHRRGLPAGRLRAARRRDGRAPGADGDGQLRPVGHRRRHRRGRRDAAAGPGPPRRRAGRHGRVRPALQRLLAGPPRAAGHRPDAAGRARRGVRAHAGRGAARPDPDLRPGLPGAGRRDGRAHVRPHHRRRPGPQPGAGAARAACMPWSSAAAGPRRRCST